MKMTCCCGGKILAAEPKVLTKPKIVRHKGLNQAAVRNDASKTLIQSFECEDCHYSFTQQTKEIL